MTCSDLDTGEKRLYRVYLCFLGSYLSIYRNNHCGVFPGAIILKNQLDRVETVRAEPVEA